MTLACSLVALALAGSGTGVKQMETVMQDDALLLHRPTKQVRYFAHQMAALGVDRVRITAGWSVLAPAPRSRRKPQAPFNPYESWTYPSGGWANLDKAVRAAAEAGLPVMLDLAFWAPRWAVARGGRDPDRERYSPNAFEFGPFAEAVARRYNGDFPDPHDPSRNLPAVRMYSTWNEPNNATFLEPQWVRHGGRSRPMSPHIYRVMHNAAYDAVKRVNPANQVLIGNTAASGGRGGVKPLRFLRELACVDGRLRPLRVPECRFFTPLRADGYAHHPYSPRMAPAGSDRDRDDAPLADTARLSTLLRALAERGRISPGLPIYQTEYAYESRPPDPFQRYSALQQARFIGQSTFLAWRDPDTAMFAQFLLRDLGPRPQARPGSRVAWGDFQSGLYYPDGNAKPAAAAFELPFWAQRITVGGQRAVLLFGQVRPGSGPQTVQVERRERRPKAPWEPLTTSDNSCFGATTFQTDAGGFFLRVAPLLSAGSYRLTWRTPDGRTQVGVGVPVSPV
jgi:hypothetical protein